MSKISYRDKIILLSFIVIAILVCGFLFLIKPKREELKSNQSTYDTKKSQLDSLEKQVDQIYDVQEHIVLTHSEAVNQAESFSQVRANDELDEYVESKMLNLYNEAGEITGLEVSNTISYAGPSTSSLTYYYYTPGILTYPIFTAADLNGEFDIKTQEILQKSNELSAKTAQTVVSSTVTLAYSGTEAELMDFLDLVANSDEKVLLNSLDMSSRTKTYKMIGNKLTETECEYEGNLTFQFYSAEVADQLYKDLFEQTSDGKDKDLEQLVSEHASSFKEKEEAE